MTSVEFYSELAKKTGMSEADSKHFWDQSAELVVDAVISKCFRDGGTLEVPGIGTARGERITYHLAHAGGDVQATRLHFDRSREFSGKLAAFRASQRREGKAERRVADNGSDIAAFAAVLEKSPELISVLRKIMYTPGPAENRASVTAIKVAVPNNSKPASARGTQPDWRTTPRVCKVCGSLFYPTRKAQDTCCSDCASKKYKQA